VATTFSYQENGSTKFGRIYVPIARVRFFWPKTKSRIDPVLIVDTGADFTILPNYLGRDLGISFKDDCIEESIGGVGGTRKTFFVKQLVPVEIGKFRRNVPLAIMEDDSVPPLLGRLGFFETFNVEFLKTKKINFKD